MPCAAPLSQLFSRPQHRHTAPARAFSCTISMDFRTEDQDDMCKTLRVRWTIIPKIAPQPWVACSGCGGLRAFQSSGKIRLNANGRKLDAWLIYKCLTCERTWNRPIIERRNVRDIDPAVLDALQSNDRDWIRAESFNLDALRRKSLRVDEFAEVEIAKEMRHETADWTKLAIELTVPVPTSTRLDRLLASELKLSRATLQALHADGMLRTDPEKADIMRRRIRNGTLVTIDLSREAGREQSWKPLATGDSAVER
ncbi:DUF1062 domain-containing protein [Rhizobium hidalgonense]|uniref:DUF1062 domain-containing protein n=1 Tax=Rhizobium hidalgonense TaxID=1538159 RepID=A0AAJ2GQY6_9HYPH|nr:DUF1062 domain-containing protein [Rhizobium hidalgonense]MDR9771354.1 DUF1062 domain-containing protein [Rhizobium hidalgonense]MDR9818615.1 DUF1062 domain-containing protein [Rhizobium hidalgonense]